MSGSATVRSLVLVRDQLSIARSIQEIRVAAHYRKLEIHLKWLESYSPRALDGVQACVTEIITVLKVREIPGALHFLSQRVIWFYYRFDPDEPNACDTIQFMGIQSNVCGIAIKILKEHYAFSNFYSFTPHLKY
jgi:hypothetical protein